MKEQVTDFEGITRDIEVEDMEISDQIDARADEIRRYGNE